MDETLIDQLVALGVLPEQEAMQMRQANQGAAMMQTPMAEGRNVGHTYVASSPLEHLSVGLQRAMGARQQDEALRQYQETLGQQTAGRSAYADALRRLMMGQQGPDPYADMAGAQFGNQYGSGD
jgi:hypothetical protein